MEELYGLHSCASAFYGQQPLMEPPPSIHGMTSSSSAFSDRIPMFQRSLITGSSVVADDASMQRGSEDEVIGRAIRAKIASHPLYPKLLQAYIDCQKVGAPPEIACVLDDIRRESDICRASSCLGDDHELDVFMETYYNLLVQYASDLSKPFNEATTFFSKIEVQLNDLCNPPISANDEAAGSSSEEFSGGEMEMQDCQRTHEERELKDKLLRKYSGYISSLKHEFSKKKKKGKLPRDARQILLNWWDIHYKWPYPTEADKAFLAESTGLDQKQINNWFINQRKRHWKPSEDMQYAVMDNICGPFFVNN